MNEYPLRNFVFHDADRHTFRLLTSPDVLASYAKCEQLLTALVSSFEYETFEFSLVANGRSEQVYPTLTCSKENASAVAGLLTSALPEVLLETEEVDETFLPPYPYKQRYVFSHACAAIRTKFATDPYTLFATLGEQLQPDERVILTTQFSLPDGNFTVPQFAFCTELVKSKRNPRFAVAIGLYIHAAEQRVAQLRKQAEDHLKQYNEVPDYVSLFDWREAEEAFLTKRLKRRSAESDWLRYTYDNTRKLFKLIPFVSELLEKYLFPADTASFMPADETRELALMQAMAHSLIYLDFRRRVLQDPDIEYPRPAHYIEQKTLNPEELEKVISSLAHVFSKRHFYATQLGVDELAALVHMPDKSITSPLLMRADRKQKSIPEFMTTRAGLHLGSAECRKQQHQIRLPYSFRTRHAYIVGASGSGKSNLLKNCIRQDIEAGRGLCVIDPHGDLVTDVLPFIPESRLADVIIFNPADRDFPVSINPFGVSTTDDDRNSIALTFQTVFMRMFGVGEEAPRMLHLLHMVTAALLEAGNKTFLDIRRFLINGDFRDEVLSSINDPTVLEFWYEEFPRDYPKAAAAPINTRLTQFSMSPITRNILGQKHQAFNLYDVMNSGKILLCPLGIIEEQERQLLGSLLVSQLQLATMRRAEMPEAERRPFMTYIDEFQNFASDAKSLEKILSEARKYGLGLVLAHQYTTQISAKLADAIMANTFTKIIFRVSSEDARYLQKSLTDFTPEDLQNQNIGQAVLCAGRAQDSFTLQTEKFPDPPKAHHAAAATEHSRRTYGRPRAEVEAELRPKKPTAQPTPAAPPQATATAAGAEPASTPGVFDDLMGDP